jgi:hypothetical protein
VASGNGVKLGTPSAPQIRDVSHTTSTLIPATQSSDIPVSPHDSMDWMNPRLFSTSFGTGAIPATVVGFKLNILLYLYTYVKTIWIAVSVRRAQPKGFDLTRWQTM